jgi:hypothetical protein
LGSATGSGDASGVASVPSSRFRLGILYKLNYRSNVLGAICFFAKC